MKGLVLAALLAGVVLLPTVAADHVYSHRYMIYGRLVDANGDPVVNSIVNVGFTNPFEPEGACAAQPGTETEAWGPTRTNPVTNDFGEFMFCFHIHALPKTRAGELEFRVGDGEPLAKVPVDALLRRTAVVLTLPDVDPNANTTARESHYTVSGRAFRESPGVIRVEGINVYGDTLAEQEIEITFGDATRTTTTNNYGDYSVRFPIDGAVPEEITVRVDGTEFRAASDPVHWTTLDAVFHVPTPTPDETTPTVSPTLPTTPPPAHTMTTPNPPETDAEIPWPTGLAVLALVAAARYRASRPK